MIKPQRLFVLSSLVLLGAVAMAGCQRKTEAPVAASPPAAGTTAVSTPAPTPAAEPEAAPLPPELAARLVRGHSPVIGPASAPDTGGVPGSRL